MSGSVEAAVRRWTEAAALLACAGRAPSTALLWLGPAWTGAAASGYRDWAGAFEQASQRAASALRAAAESLRALTSNWPELRLDSDLDGVDEGSREIAAVPIPGQRKPSSQPEATEPPGEPEHKPDPEPASLPEQPAPAAASNPRAGRVDAWIDHAVRVLLEHGYRPEQMDREAIATIIKYESSGNPAAVNNWDSNAARGTPSMGLMQTIGPTFDRWHLPGHDQILDPVDNIIAGVRYAVARYGSVSQVPGLLSLAAGEGYRGY